MSGLPFELLLALRYLRPKRTFVSVITFISVLGVALGVAVLIIVISVMTGFGKQLRDTVLGFTPHLTIYEPGVAMTNYSAVLSTVASNRNVVGVAPYVIGPVLLETEPESGQPVQAAPTIRGIDPEAEVTVSSLASDMREGTFDVSGNGILIGNAFAEKMGLQVGDRVNVFGLRDVKRFKETQAKGQAEAPLPDQYVVRGIFDVGYYEFNATVVVISLQNAQDLYDLGDGVHGLMAKVRDPFLAETARKELKHSVDASFEIRTWLEQSSLLAAVLVEKNVMLYIMFFIVIVAAFGITCTLITFIVMKTREIGVLKALGASNRQVMWVFMGQSLVVSILGVIVGLSGGLLLVQFRNPFLELMRKTTGMQLFPADIYQFTQLPAQIVPGDIAIICGGSLLICLAAAAFPARYASRLNPVEALRYE